MKWLFERIFKRVNDVEHIRNTFAPEPGKRFDQQWLAEDTLDPYTVHAMCFPPPRYWADSSKEAQRP